MNLFDKLKKRKMNDSYNPKKPQIPNIIGKYYKLEDIRSKNAGGLYLSPIDAGSFFGDFKTDSFMLSTLGNTERIRRYLPGMDLSSIESAESYLKYLMIRTEMGYEFAYAIRQGRGLLGVINVKTPDLNKLQVNFPHWSLDFFVFEVFENSGIMTTALGWVLYFLKSKLHVGQVYAAVDPENVQSLAVLKKTAFDEVKNDGEGRFLYNKNNGSRARLFVCDLNYVTFNLE